MTPIRNAAKAIIVKDEKVLLIKNQNDEGFYYSFPGGGQEYGEQLSDTIKRECLEEIGEEIKVGNLVFVREYIGQNHASEAWYMDMHQVEFYFRCTLASDSAAFSNASNPDSEQVDVEWVELNALESIRIYPRTLVSMLKKGNDNICYLGDVT